MPSAVGYDVFETFGDVMKKILAAAMLVATGATAQAADLAVKAPAPVYKAPVVSRVYDWTGFYFGINGGLGTSRSLTEAGAISRLGGFGGIGGAQLGYNWQFANLIGFSNVVLGLETDIQGSGLQDNWTCVMMCSAGVGFVENQKLGWLGTARGRVGLANGPVLSYVTAGFAYGNVNTTITDLSAPAGATSFSSTRTGWTVGTGVEAALGGNWTGKIEYLYVSLGTQTGANLTAPTPYVFSSNVVEHVFRAGLNYRIGANGVYAPEPAANWSGLYLGGTVGGALALNRSSLTAPGVAGEQFNLLTSDGYTGGGQIGYNWQTANWVLGVETDLQGSTQRENKTCELTCTAAQYATFNMKMQWLGTTRGRIGYSLGSTLFYLTGGAAYGDTNTSVAGFFGAPFAQSISHTKTGYAAGGGIESPFNLFGWFGPNWTSKTEYLYVDLGHTTDAIVGTNFTVSTHIQEQILRTGLNYHFNQPVVARY
jgi:outer membrane immunogenic protein